MSALRAAVVGVRGIGLHHAQELATLEEYALVGLCDRNPQTLAAATAKVPAKGYVDLDSLLEEAKPQVVVVATDNRSHARVAIRCAEAGVPGIFLEKPMAVDAGDARAILAACNASGARLVVNHQRRTYPAVRKMRALIASGAIGKVEVLRASHAGDVLSDGTHAIDSLCYLAGDAPVAWVAAQVFRKPYPSEPVAPGFEASNGTRYGHVVEDGAVSVWQFEGGPRAELFSGEMMLPGRWYQDYEAVGESGRIRRPPDGSDLPKLLMQTSGAWEEVPLDDVPPLPKPLAMFADTVQSGAPHPMSGEVGLQDMEIVNAIYESARVRDRVPVPAPQDRFALEQIVGVRL